MAMTTAYLDAIRDHGQTLITHIGLVNSAGVELSSAGYARQAVTWTDDAGSVSRPTADLVFDTEAGDEVAGWRGYSASTAGTNYGGADFTAVTFANPGTFTLLAASTSIDHNAS
jgi:hypothetical protein